MLRNPAYAGRAAFLKTGTTDRRPAINRQGRLQGRSISRHYAKFERPKQDWITIAVPAIITEATFALAERRLAENRRFAARNSKEPSLLMGLAACQSCGYAYYRTSTRTAKRKIYYYRCLGSDDYRYPGGRVCDNKPVRADYLDGLVWGQVTALLADPALVQGELDRRLTEMRAANPATSERARLERDYTRATKRKLANLPARPTPPEGGLPRYGAELKAVREGRADHACSWSMIILITSLDGDMVELEHWFRERAQVEERLKDSKYGAALRHLPSGHKVVNAVWTWSAFLALNISAVLSAFARLAPAPATGGGSPGTDATSPSGQGRRRRHQGPLRAHGKRLRREIINVPGRLARHASGLVVHLHPSQKARPLARVYEALLALPSFGSA
jgi:hypothetical protein